MSAETNKKLSFVRNAIIGLFLALLAIAALYFAERYFSKTSRTLEEVMQTVVNLPNIQKLNSKFDGKIVYAQGRVIGKELVQDETFGIKINALGLMRQVKYFQWQGRTAKEKEAQSDGKAKNAQKEAYAKSWMSKPLPLINDAKNNILIYEVESGTAYVRTAKLGAYTLSQKILQALDNFKIFKPKFTADRLENIHIAVLAASERSDELSESIEKFYANVHGEQESLLAHVHGNELFLGENFNKPNAGDLRLTFAAIAEQEVSVIAKVSGASLVPFTTSTGQEFFMLNVGNVSLKNMLKHSGGSNSSLLWIIRLVCLAFMGAGVRMFIMSLKKQY